MTMRILVIQLRQIGDVLLTTPVLPFLKKALPDSSVEFLTEQAGAAVLETNPHLNRVLIYDKSHAFRELKRLRAEKYDVVIDFMNNPTSRYITLATGARWRASFMTLTSPIFFNVCFPTPEVPDYVPIRKLKLVKFLLEKMGLPTPAMDQIRPELPLTGDDEAFADEWLDKEGLTPGKFALLLPAHRRPIRQWRADGFKEVGDRLVKELALKVVVACGPGEDALLEPVLQGREPIFKKITFTALRQAAAVMKKAALVVCNDSGLMHLAVSVGTPTVTIYGPSRPIDWNPSLHEKRAKPNDIPLQAKGVSCLGCHLLDCPVGHICMTRLSSDDVYQACRLLVSANRPSL